MRNPDQLERNPEAPSTAIFQTSLTICAQIGKYS